MQTLKQDIERIRDLCKVTREHLNLSCEDKCDTKEVFHAMQDIAVQALEKIDGSSNT